MRIEDRFCYGPRRGLGAGVCGSLMVGLLVLGCAVEEPGVAPLRDRFYFPTGVAQDVSRQHLYVSSSNSDLMYNGGTLIAVDLKNVPADLSTIGAQVQAGKLACSPDRVDSTLWECLESQFINPDSTVRIGDFPSELAISSDGKRLYTPVRGEQHLLWVDVQDLPGGGVDLRCNRSTEDGCGTYTNRDCPVWDCNDAHRISADSERGLRLPLEPRGIFVNELTAVFVDNGGVRHTCRDDPKLPCAVSRDAQTGVCTAGSQTVTCCPSTGQPLDCWVPAPGLDHIYVAHLFGGEVSFFTVNTAAGEDELVRLRDVRAGFFSASGGIYGGFGLAAWTPGDPETPVSVSSRSDASIASFVIDSNRQIIDSARTTVAALSPANDFRGLAFDPPSRRLFAVNRLPPALVALDMSLEAGRPRRETLWVTEVCPDPSGVTLAPDPTRKGDPSALLAYVVCFGSSQIFVMDTRDGRLLDQISTGHGPNQLIMDPSAPRAFVTNFLDNTVGVIDLDPSHARFNRMVMRIGMVTDLIR